MESLIGIGRSESYADLNNPDFARSLNLFANAGECRRRRRFPSELLLKQHRISLTGSTRGRHSFSGKSTTEVDPLNANGKPFGIGKLHLLLFSKQLFSVTERKSTLKIQHIKFSFPFHFLRVSL